MHKLCSLRHQHRNKAGFHYGTPCSYVQLVVENMVVRLWQELSLLAGGGDMCRSGSEEIGVAQFASTMSVPQDAAWSARFNTFPMASSLPTLSPLLVR